MAESTVEKSLMLYSQEQAEYVPLSMKRGAACANCRWFVHGEYDHCHIVDSYPADILATGWCNQHTPIPVPEPMTQDPMPVVIVEPEMSTMEMEFQKPGVFERILKAITDRLNPPSEPVNVFKAIDDKHWIAYYTNNFEDRTGEVLMESAHDKYIRRLKEGIVPMPTLRYRHIPGSDHGRALAINRIDNFVVAVGEYSDDDMGRAFSQHYQKSGKLFKNSHGFVASKQRDYIERDGVGYWKNYNTFEITVSPAQVVANAYTMFEDNDMTPNPQALAEFAAIVGDDKAKEIIAKAETLSKEYKERGIHFKDFTDATALETPAAQPLPHIGNLLSELLTAMGDLSKAQLAQEKRQAEVETKEAGVLTRLTELEKQFKEISTLLALTPRRASEAQSTQLTEAETVEVQKHLAENGKKDTFWS